MIYAEYESLMTIELPEKIFRFRIGVDACQEHLPALISRHQIDIFVTNNKKF
jgi:hypothetical protein